jgi:Fe-S oxidoreductase
MDTRNDLIDTVKGLLANNCVILTDIEDQYVYSFEKVFMDQKYPRPDIVIKVSPEESENIIAWAKNKRITMIQRGDPPQDHLKDTILVLLDNTEIPEIKKLTKNDKFAISQTPLNNAMAMQNLLSRQSANLCQACTTCSGYCTVSPSYNGIETWSSKGRALLIRGIIKGELPLTNKAVEIIYTCSKCGLCFANCVKVDDFQKAILSMRNKVAEKEMVPTVFHSLADNIAKHGDPSAVPRKRRISWMKDLTSDLPEQAEYLYWVGCMTANRTPKTAKAFFNILKRTKTDFTILGEDEGCCAYVLLSAGLWDEAKVAAKKVIEKISGAKSQTLITPCSGCYYTFTVLYPEYLGVTLPCKVLHSTQFIEERLKTGIITFKSLDLEITYHDPCSLGRLCNVYDAPRNILKAIPDLKLIEMQLTKENARCCGGGGGLWAFNNEVSKNSTENRLQQDLLPLEVNTITTACPQCQINFRFTSRKISKTLKINDITEIIESAMI